MPHLRIGTAGWRIATQHGAAFVAGESHLERYATVFSCVEINSSFHRPHRPSTYARWAASVPAGFRFSLKIPKEITHKRKLVDFDDLLQTFLDDTKQLGDALGPYIVQLAPSLAFEDAVATAFFRGFRDAFGGGIACEPRHGSWFTPEASVLLERFRVTRIGSDPASAPGSEVSASFGGFAYYRWHGSPRTYYSEYGEERLRAFAQSVARDFRKSVVHLRQYGDGRSAPGCAAVPAPYCSAARNAASPSVASV